MIKEYRCGNVIVKIHGKADAQEMAQAGKRFAASLEASKKSCCKK